MIIERIIFLRTAFQETLFSHIRRGGKADFTHLWKHIVMENKYFLLDVYTIFRKKIIIKYHSHISALNMMGIISIL